MSPRAAEERQGGGLGRAGKEVAQSGELVRVPGCCMGKGLPWEVVLLPAVVPVALSHSPWPLFTHRPVCLLSSAYCVL